MARTALHRVRDAALWTSGAGLAFHELALSPEPRFLLVAAGLALLTIPVNAHVNRMLGVPAAAASKPPTDDDEASVDPLADVCCDMGRIAWPAPCPWHSGPTARAVLANDPPSMVIVAAGRHLTVPAVGPTPRCDLVVVRGGTPSLHIGVAVGQLPKCDDVLARLHLPADTVAIRQGMIVNLSDERAGQSG